jgi:hypothetical protein
MDKKSRRWFLCSCSLAGSGFLAGCIAGESGKETTAPSAPDTEENGGRPTTTSTTASPTSSLAPEDLLPREADGWTRNRTERGAFSWSARGAEDGVFGYYTSPEDRTYKVVIMKMKEGYSPERKAVSWKCSVEWSAALSYGRFSIAASTGTAQRTFTPEKPPHMTRTPIPDTTEPAKELLANSPELSREYVDGHAVTEADC